MELINILLGGGILAFIQWAVDKLSLWHNKNHIKEILKDMCVTFTDEMDKADTEAEMVFKNSFR